MSKPIATANEPATTVDPDSLVGIDPDRNLQAALVAVHCRVYEIFAGFAPLAFFRQPGDAWSPAEHLVHLCKSETAVARGMSVPRLLLWLRFGSPRGPSRPYATIREVYRAGLAKGAKAPGAFVPPVEEPPVDEVEAARRQAETLERWQRAHHRLEDTLAGWPGAELDRRQLPHPILGKLTVREMLLFTTYHDLHHAARVLERSSG